MDVGRMATPVPTHDPLTSRPFRSITEALRHNADPDGRRSGPARDRHEAQCRVPRAAGDVRGGGLDGPATVLTFRSSGGELEALSHMGHPFFRPRWAPDVVGMVLDADVDWSEVAELVTESYRVMAPKKLAASVE